MPEVSRRVAIAARLGFLVSVLALGLAASAPARADDAKQSTGDLRGERYCEIIPAFRDGLKMRLEVYNTLGQNDCPAAVWDALDADRLAEQLGADKVVLNGPRFWMMDRIGAGGATATGATKNFDGLAATQRATFTLPIRDVLFGSKPYAVHTIERSTTYTFDAGKPVYEITDADGHVYVMQTFAQIVDKTLSMDDLAGLGSRLKLPEGWTYASRTPDADLILTAAGEAFLIQDDLQNSYQRRN